VKEIQGARCSRKKNIRHILFVGHTGQLGGAELSLLDLVVNIRSSRSVVLLSSGPLQDMLARQGIEVITLEGARDLVAIAKNASFTRTLCGIARLPHIVHHLARLASQSDVIYANTKKSILPSILAARLVKRPFIWHQRDAIYRPSSLPPRERLSESTLIRLLNRWATRVISVSHAAAQTLIEAGGRSTLPVVVHNGIDPGPFLSDTDPIAIRRRVGLPSSRPLIGCFGRLTPWKGQSVLIEALKQVPHADLALVGGAIFADSKYKALLERQLRNLRLTDRVHFLGHREDIPMLMKAVDIIVHPSVEFDPCPRVVLEALHSGKPIIATAVGGVPELINDGATGLLVPPKDPIALGRSIRHLLGSPSLAARLANNGRRRAKEYFTRDRMLQQLENEIYKCTMY